MKNKQIKVDVNINSSSKTPKIKKKKSVEGPIIDTIDDVKELKKSLTQAEIDTLLKDVTDYCKQATKFHLEQVKAHTDEILVSDVMYCIELSERMLKKKKTELIS